MKPLVLSPGVEDDAPIARLYYGQDVRETLRGLPESSVHTVCTSPPYFGLRDYGTGDSQIGLEPTPEEFVESLVDVFREIKRVLRPDGTLWVNIGDTYSRGSRNTNVPQGGVCASGRDDFKHTHSSPAGNMDPASGIKPKDLIGIPWMVALALRKDGWYLRQDIIWHKPACMPESVADRCTNAHEYVFLFAHPDSGGRYYYDAEAVREASSNWNGQGDTRNKRSVWSVNPKPYKGAHFAVWPPDLVRPMILAGCPVGGVVLDPFSGSATTGMVALHEGRNYVGIDLNPDYLDLAQARIEGAKPPTPKSDEEPPLDIMSLLS